MIDGIFYIFLAIGVVVLLVLVFPVPMLVARVYKWQYGLTDSTEIAKRESETRAAMAQLGVGLAAFLVFWTALKSFEATNENIRLATENIKLAATGQLAERFSKAVSLVNEKGKLDGIAARVGGIFALEGIVESDDSYLKPSIHVLTAMIRRESRKGEPSSYCAELDKVADTEPYAAPATHSVPEPDVVAALDMIRRQAALRKGLAGELDLSHAGLCLAYLPASRFEGVQLRDSDIRGAILDCADLTEAGLSAANLTGAHLPKAKLKEAVLRWTTLDKADLCGADLSEADLKNATLEDANLSGANLKSARNVTPEQLSKACYSNNAHPLLPAELKDLQMNECGNPDHTRALGGKESVWKKTFQPACNLECAPAEADEAES